MWIADKWKEYELLDCGGGERLENWAGYTLVRPDPQAIWPRADSRLWDSPNATYYRSSAGGGQWQVNSLPQSWQLAYENLTFNIKPMSFKHTGVFPEQAANWQFIADAVSRRGDRPQVLNLFAYTGGATLAAAGAGAAVCHVDASRGMVGWARENAKVSGLENAPIRYIVDDCMKFIRREITRGRKYDGIIMDPPSYGRGPSGEVWRFEEGIFELIELCVKLLSERALFFIVNSYTAGISPSVPGYILGNTAEKKLGGRVESEELGLRVKATGLCLPCGHTSRWIGK